MGYPVVPLRTKQSSFLGVLSRLYLYSEGYQTVTHTQGHPGTPPNHLSTHTRPRIHQFISSSSKKINCKVSFLIYVVYTHGCIQMSFYQGKINVYRKINLSLITDSKDMKRLTNNYSFSGLRSEILFYDARNVSDLYFLTASTCGRTVFVMILYERVMGHS